MNARIRLVSMAAVVSFASPVLAEQDIPQSSSMLEGLQDLAAIADEGGFSGFSGFYDNAPSAGRPAAATPSSALTVQSQSQLLRAGATPVFFNTKHDKTSAFQRGYYAVMNPAIEIYNTDSYVDWGHVQRNPYFGLVALVVGAVLAAPAVIFGLLNFAFEMV